MSNEMRQGATPENCDHPAEDEVKVRQLEKDFTCDTRGGWWSGTVIRPRHPADVPENDLDLRRKPA
jgi:hypothetical protein